MTAEAPRIWTVDDTPSSRFPLYTRGNVGEVFPTVVSPLTWSLLGNEAELGWRDAYRDIGVSVPRDFAETADGTKVILGVFGGYCYLNLTYLRLLAVRTPGLAVEQLDQQIFGESDAPPYEKRAGDASIVASLRLGRGTVRTLRTKSLPALEADKAEVRAWLSALPDPDRASDEALLDVILGFRPLFRRLFQRHIAISFLTNTGPAVLAQICERQLGDPTLPNRLLAGLGSVESAAPSAALWELARRVADEPILTAAFDNGLDGLLARLEREPGTAAFLEQFRDFLSEFGSRGPNEWEGSSPTWGTSPELALAAVDRMRFTELSHAPADQQARLAHERAIATANARQRLRAPARRFFDLALQSAHVFSQGRERSKTTIIRAIHGARVAQRELARRARERGGPDTLADCWLVTIDELSGYVKDPTAFIDVIDERRALRDKLAARVPPFVFEGRIPPVETWDRRDTPVDTTEAGTELRGIPGCPGVARGRARVVLDPADPRGLAPGEVLIAPITDPAWTPLFVPAEAVVVDVGAQLSHAVIVSRELGIPAVVSVTGATARIPDGALVEVDGDRGVVRVLEV